MPGLRRQPGISSYTNSLYHADMHTAAQQQQYSWDREHSIVSRRPLQVPPQWLKQQGREKHNYLGTKPVSAVSAVPVRYGSNESDDLQAMVHDFIENDSLDYMDGGDSDGPAPAKKLIETLQVCFFSASFILVSHSIDDHVPGSMSIMSGNSGGDGHVVGEITSYWRFRAWPLLQALTAPGSLLERELLKEVKLQLLSIKEDSDLVCEPEGSDCKGGCVKRFVVSHLKVTGYDAAVCKSKWLSSGRVPGGKISQLQRFLAPSEFWAYAWLCV